MSGVGILFATKPPMEIHMEISKNQAAFITVSALAAVTAGSILAATATASTVAAVAYGVLGVTSFGASMASISAWVDTSAITVKDYFSTFQKHAGIAIAGAYTFVSTVVIEGFVRGLGDGISTAVRRALAGPDVTIQQR